MWGPAFPLNLKKILCICSLSFSMVTNTYGVNSFFVHGKAEVAGIVSSGPQITPSCTK